MTTNPWYRRRSENSQYLFMLMGSFIIAYTILMAIPFMYDQWNRELYAEAIVTGQLIIQEFSSILEKAVVDDCGINNGGIPCDAELLYSIFAEKKLIALDYVGQMENKTLTSTTSFIFTAATQLGVLIAGVFGVATIAKSHTSRFLGFVFVFMFILVGYHVLSDLPHKNTKYYYIFGALFAVLLSVSDFFHRLEVTKEFGSLSSKATAAVATTKYNKWSSVFQFSLGILAAVIGTISFSVLGHIRTIFGESFVFYPLLGILVSMSYLALIFYFGIIRNILLILGELEGSMATQEVTHAPEIPPDRTVSETNP